LRTVRWLFGGGGGGNPGYREKEEKKKKERKRNTVISVAPREVKCVGVFPRSDGFGESVSR
jgi:hypothetical protein